MILFFPISYNKSIIFLFKCLMDKNPIDNKMMVGGAFCFMNNVYNRLVKTELNKFSGTGKILPEFFWCAAFFLFKQPVKVGNIIEPATIRNFRHGVGSIN